MVYTIRVQQNAESTQGRNLDLFAKNFNTEEEFNEVFSLCDNKRRIGWLESLKTPVRTDTNYNFYQDLFLPGYFNVALQTRDLATKIFLCITLLIWDVFTFPVRAFAAICRYNANPSKESHPFYQYLIRNGVAAKHLNDGCVYLEITRRKENGHSATITGSTFNFIELPENATTTRESLVIIDP